MKKRILLALVLGLILALAMGAPALAEHNPTRDHHHHHIHLPNENCVDVPATHKAGGKSPALDHAWQSPCPS